MADFETTLPLGEHPPEYYSHVQWAIEPLLPARTTRLLEIGCGAGATVNWIRSIRQVDYARGFELDPVPAERARQVFDDVVVGDVEQSRPALEPGRYDLVLALNVLEHVYDPWTILRWVREAMVPGGTIILSLPNIAHYSISLPLLLRGAFDYTDEGILDRTHKRFFNRVTAWDLLRDSGFTVTGNGAKKSVPDFVSMAGLTTPRWARLRWYNKRFLERYVPGRLTDFEMLIAAVRPPD